MQRGFTNPIELQHSASLQTEKKRNLNINFLHINKALSVSVCRFVSQLSGGYFLHINNIVPVFNCGKLFI